MPYSEEPWTPAPGTGNVLITLQPLMQFETTALLDFHHLLQNYMETTWAVLGLMFCIRILWSMLAYGGEGGGVIAEDVWGD